MRERRAVICRREAALSALSVKVFHFHSSPLAALSDRPSSGLAFSRKCWWRGERRRAALRIFRRFENEVPA